MPATRCSTFRATTALLCVAAIISLAGCGQATPTAITPQQPETKTVKMVGIETRSADRYVEITGTLYGEEEVTIAAKVPGRVVAIEADLGDIVPHGQALVQIDPVDYQLAVNEQEAALSAALAKVGLEALPDGEVDLAALPVVARAMAEESNARARLDRARKLYERQPPLISEQDFADIRTQHEVATTSAAVERLNAGSLIADARVRASALRAAQQRLGDSRVVAPVEKPLIYRIAARRVSVGEMVASGQPLFRLVASDRVKFRGMAPERFAGQLVVGAPAKLTIDGFDEPFEAAITRVAPAVDVASRTFEIEIGAANPEGRLKPGSFVRANVLTKTETNAKFVPESAVMQFAGVQRVFSVKDGKAVEHRVDLGPLREGWRELLEQLEGVEQVIDKPRGMRAGLPVTLGP